MTKSLNIIVCGAGISGLGAAIALKRKGHQVSVIEAASQLQESGAGIQVPPNSLRILKSWGLETKFIAKVMCPKSVAIRRYATGEVIGRTEMNPVLQDKYGFPYWFIHRADYQNILYDAAIEAGIQILLGTPIESVDEKEPTVILASGKELKADLIVGADGVRSRTRASVLKEEVEALESSQCAYSATVPVNLMNSDPNLAHLMTDVNANLWLGPDGHIMGYPIRNGEVYNLVLVSPGKASVGKWNDRADVEEMRSRHAEWEPTVQRLLSHVTTCLKWKLAYVPPLERWASKNGRVVIIGDAAHAMLPLLSQGAAVSIEDGTALAECLDRVTDLVDLSPVLRAFQDLRKSRCETISKAALSLVDLWHLHDGPEQEGRDLKMKQDMTNTVGVTSDSKSSLDMMRDKFVPWMFGYDTVRQANMFLDSHLTRKGIGEGFVSRAIEQGGFLSLGQ
ncbi:FAD-dependent monooxygenase OpS4 [Lachnellula arida]|uniref:FAD-dependent monooxygenase OpS4 n=1 Tax=Lachnellula arida TaxID=1316785 RepID=A0A8T9BA33_9HELO|nr:FAD-dependent monooxygenase OpS4 [Lachnellula arida]